MKNNNANSIIKQFYEQKVQPPPQLPKSNEKSRTKNETSQTRAAKYSYLSPSKSYKVEDENGLQHSERRLRITEIES
jgi:hypothetical protein